MGEDTPSAPGQDQTQAARGPAKPPTILAEGASNDIGSNHTSWRRAGATSKGQGYGLVLFAAILVAIIGCFNLVDGSRQNLAAV